MLQADETRASPQSWHCDHQLVTANADQKSAQALVRNFSSCLDLPHSRLHYHDDPGAVAHVDITD